MTHRMRILAVLLLGTLAVGTVWGAGAREPAAVAEQDNTLVVILGSDPEHLNPGISTSYPIGAVGASLFSALVSRDSTGRPQPELAERWTVSADNLVYTFSLRSANWHDGQPLTSADVKFSMEEVLAPNHGRFRTAFQFISAIETPNERTVVIRLSRPYAPLINLLTVFDAPILPKHIFEGTDPLTNPANQTPIGSGPFRFVEWVRGDRIILERNPDYFLDPAHLERVIYRVIPQDVARSIAIETGEADLLWGFYMPTSDLDRLEANPNVNIWKGLTIPSLYFVFINTDRPALGDPRVRQAIMHAIDREQIVEQAQGGLGTIEGGPFGAGFDWATSAESDYRTLFPHDPARARQLLAAAGVQNLTLDFVYDSARGAFASAAEIMRDNLRQVGITLNIQPVERSVMVERVYGRQYDLSMQSFTSGGDPAIGYHRIYLTTAAGTNFANATGWGNPEVDRILAEAASVSDIDRRAALYRQAFAIIAPEIPVLVLFNELSTEAYNVRLTGQRQRLDQRDGLELVRWR